MDFMTLVIEQLAEQCHGASIGLGSND
jgi:hypothetical protein